jgi:sugar lactone lactonase YvrE
VDDRNVDWAVVGQDDQGGILSVPRTGGAVVTLAQLGARSMASDGEALYWVGLVGTTQGSVYRVPTVGGAVTTLATAPNLPACLAIDAANVYWTAGAGERGTAVLQVAKTGGAVRTLTTTSSGVPSGIVAAPTTVYWGSGSILGVPLDGGASATLSPLSAGLTPGRCASLSLVNDALFALLVPPTQDAGVPSIVKLATSGPAGPSVVVSSGNPGEAVADEGGVLWVGGYGTTTAINHTSFDGGTTTLTRVAGEVGDIALASDGTLYWTTQTQVQSMKP